jgi:hypothetical protein
VEKLFQTHRSLQISVILQRAKCGVPASLLIGESWRSLSLSALAFFPKTCRRWNPELLEKLVQNLSAKEGVKITINVEQ